MATLDLKQLEKLEAVSKEIGYMKMYFDEFVEAIKNGESKKAKELFDNELEEYRHRGSWREILGVEYDKDLDWEQIECFFSSKEDTQNDEV